MEEITHRVVFLDELPKLAKLKFFDMNSLNPLEKTVSNFTIIF